MVEAADVENAASFVAQINEIYNHMKAQAGKLVLNLYRISSHKIVRIAKKSDRIEKGLIYKWQSAGS